MNRTKNILIKIGGTLILPVAMYIGMMILSFSHDKMYFGTLMMWRTIIVSISLSIASALGIGLQFKSGRFDFSGGSIMLLTAIIAGNIARFNGNNIVLMFILCLVVATLLSVIVSSVYVLSRVPIIIVTIGMALLFESITTMLYGGTGINLVSNMKLRIFSTYPMVLIPLAGTIIVYWLFSYVTKAGKQSTLLARNQQAAVHIGINEKKNVIISYVFSGLIFGFGTVIYMAMGIHRASFTSLITVGELFSNILPVFIGLILSGFCGDLIGTIMGAITLNLLSYTMTAVYSANMGVAITIICTGIFVFAINVISAQGRAWLKAIGRLFMRRSTESNQT